MALAWDRLGVHLVSANRYLCEPGWRLGPQWTRRLRDFDLWLVFKGAGTMWVDGEPVPLRPGVGFWMRPGGDYVGEQDPDHRLGVNFIHFELVGPDGVRHREPGTLAAAGLGQVPGQVHMPADLGYVDAVMRRIVALSRTVDETDGARRQVAEALLRGLLMDLDAGEGDAGSPAMTATARHHRDVVMAAAARIDESPANAPPIATLARTAGYSADHFTRLFKEHLGLNPQAYLVRARIDRARQLLHESSLTLGEIARMLGYTDVFFFCRQFKQKTGQTPTAYRRGLSN